MCSPCIHRDNLIRSKSQLHSQLAFEKLSSNVSISRADGICSLQDRQQKIGRTRLSEISRTRKHKEGQGERQGVHNHEPPDGLVGEDVLKPPGFFRKSPGLMCQEWDGGGKESARSCIIDKKLPCFFYLNFHFSLVSIRVVPSPGRCKGERGREGCCAL